MPLIDEFQRRNSGQAMNRDAAPSTHKNGSTIACACNLARKASPRICLIAAKTDSFQAEQMQRDGLSASSSFFQWQALPSSKGV
jgi:hypothetical protein